VKLSIVYSLVLFLVLANSGFSFELNSDEKPYSYDPKTVPFESPEHIEKLLDRLPMLFPQYSKGDLGSLNLMWYMLSNREKKAPGVQGSLSKTLARVVDRIVDPHSENHDAEVIAGHLYHKIGARISVKHFSSDEAREYYQRHLVESVSPKVCESSFLK